MSGSEIAYFGLTPTDIDELSECEEPGARKAYAMLRHSEQLLATVLVGNNLVNITMVVLLTFAINQTVTFASPVADFLVQTVFLTFLLLLFGEIFPKLVARGNARRWIESTVGIMGTNLYSSFAVDSSYGTLYCYCQPFSNKETGEHIN